VNVAVVIAEHVTVIVATMGKHAHQKRRGEWRIAVVGVQRQRQGA